MVSAWSRVGVGASLLAAGCLVPKEEPAHPELANQPAQLLEEKDWSDEPPALKGLSRRESLSACYMTDAAFNAGITNATARVMVDVRPDGKAGSVTVVEDPGFGLGKAAAQCAKEKRFEPARDAQGRTVPGQLSIRVRFLAK